MKKFIFRSFITLSILFAIHSQCSAATRSPSVVHIPNKIKIIVAEVAVSDKTNKYEIKKKMIKL